MGPALRLAARLLAGAAVRRDLGLLDRGPAPAVLPARARVSCPSPTRLARLLHPSAGLPAAVLVACPPPVLPAALGPAAALLSEHPASCAASCCGSRRGRCAPLEADPPHRAARHAAAGRALLRSRALDAPDVGEHGRRRGRVAAAADCADGGACWRGRSCRCSRPARRSGRACCATPRPRASCRSRTGRSRRPSTWPPCCRGSHEPIGGVLGTHVPVIADAEDFMLHVPGWRAGALVLLYGIALILAVRATPRSRPALLYLLAARARGRGVPVSRARRAPHDPLPDAALPAGGRARRLGGAPGRTSRRAWILVLALAALHLAGGTQLLDAWRSTDRAQAAVPAAGPASRRAGARARAGCATRTRPTGRRFGSPGRAASGSWPRRPGTTASATGRCRCSTRCASRRTSPGC